MNNSAPIPHLVTSDAVAAIAFYEQSFAAVCNNKHVAQDGNSVMHASLTAGYVQLTDPFGHHWSVGGPLK